MFERADALLEGLATGNCAPRRRLHFVLCTDRRARDKELDHNAADLNLNVAPLVAGLCRGWDEVRR